MEYNYVSIDPSITSTAMVVNGKIFNWCRESSATNKKGLSKWFKSCEDLCEFRFVKLRKSDDYSTSEIYKINDYDIITNDIISVILDNINPELETIIACEGYNYGSQVGDLVDLVTFSSLLRVKLKDISKSIYIISPSTLKLESCKLTYEPIKKEVGKKNKKIEYEYRNTVGLAGGKFTKHDMAYAIIENNNINHPWFQYLKINKSEIVGMNSIPKPHEDINDAILLYFILKNNKWE